MKTYDLDSWEAFGEVVKQSNIETEELRKSAQTISSTTPIIYRGQADSIWHLKSVLERKVKKDITVDIYFNLMLKVWNSPASTFKKRWPDLENEIRGLNVNNIYFDTTGLMKHVNDTIQTEKAKPMKKKIIISETKVNWNRKAVRVRRVLPLMHTNFSKR